MKRIDLTALVPEDYVFTWKGQDYVLPGEVGLLTMMKALDLGIKYANASAAGSEQETREALSDLHALVVEMVRERQPEVTAEELNFGPTICMELLGMATGREGPITLDDAVRKDLMEAFADGDGEEGEADEADPPTGTTVAPNRAARRAVEKAGRSPKPSPVPS